MYIMTEDEPRPDLASQKVLVVEDEVALRSLLADVLRDAHLTVLEAPNADAALEILRTQRDIALVFTDVRMPGSMNGIELAGIVQSEFPKTKIIVTSGRRKSDEWKKGLQWVQKPYLYWTVMDAILTALHQKWENI